MHSDPVRRLFTLGTRAYGPARWWRTSLQGVCRQPTTPSLGSSLRKRHHFGFLPLCGSKDSVITSRFSRQLSGKSVVDDEAFPRCGLYHEWLGSSLQGSALKACQAAHDDRVDGSPRIQSKDVETDEEEYPDYPTLGRHCCNYVASRT